MALTQQITPCSLTHLISYENILFKKKNISTHLYNLKGECHLYKPQGKSDIFSVVLVGFFFFFLKN